MTTSRLFISFVLLIIAAGLISISLNFRSSGQERATAGNPVVATVGGRSITLQEVEQTVPLSLYQADQRRSQLLQQTIQHMIDEQLLAAEASRKGLSVSELLDEASQSESIARIANLPAPVKRLSPGSGQNSLDRDSAQDFQEQARIRQALLVSLRRKTEIRVNLPTPEPPILAVSSDDDPRLGPDNAPITIVEFSDFQCPYCQRSVGVMKDLRRIYGEKIQLVYRDFPGPNHPYAEKAAEAAQCAGEQGKFWEYHDILFDRQTSGTGWDFLTLATELDLRKDAFTACLNSGRFREEVAKDLQDGFKLGITSTPTFFVNGRPLIGAQPLASFRMLIDKLLDQRSHS